MPSPPRPANKPRIRLVPDANNDTDVYLGERLIGHVDHADPYAAPLDRALVLHVKHEPTPFTVRSFDTVMEILERVVKTNPGYA